MRHKDNVVGRHVGLAVHRIVQRGRPQNPARFEGETLARRKISLEAGRDHGGAGRAHRALSSSTGLAECPLAPSIASLRSASRSRRSSIPTDKRTSSGVTPVSLCSSTVSWEWVVDAGWITSDLASPMLASKENSLSELISFLPASKPPLMPKVTSELWPSGMYFFARA